MWRDRRYSALERAVSPGWIKRRRRGIEPRLGRAGWKAGGPSDRHVGITKGEQRGRDEARRQPAANLVQATTLEDSAILAVTGLHVDEIAALRRDT
jgi:hypothetical protein